MDAFLDHIGVVPLGDVPPIAPKVVAAHVSGYLNLPVDIIPALEIPNKVMDESRFQYSAALIIQKLESLHFEGYRKVIAVTDVDISIPIFTHVFGEARQGGKVALVSLYRLRRHSDGSVSPPALVFERAAKIALHELGHLYNVLHCDDELCLMHFSGKLMDLDRIFFSYCRYCTAYLRDAMDKGKHPVK